MNVLLPAQEDFDLFLNFKIKLQTFQYNFTLHKQLLCYKQGFFNKNWNIKLGRMYFKTQIYVTLLKSMPER